MRRSFRIRRVRQVCLYLTRACNLKCSYCKVPLYQSSKALTADQWLLYLEALKKKVKPEFVILFGGEPTLLEGIEDIIDYLNDWGIAYTLISNGVGLQKRFWLLSKVRGLTLSIDCLEPQDGSDERAKSNWDLLKDLSKVSGLDLVANITVTKSNIDELEAIVEKLNSLDVWIIFSWLMWNGRSCDRFRSYCPQLAIVNDIDFAKFEQAFFKAKKRHNPVEYLYILRKHYKNLDWFYRYDDQAPQYMIINDDGRFISDPDYWGKAANYVHLLDDDFSIDKWWYYTKLDLEDSRCPGNIWNHILQLTYNAEVVHWS